MKRPRGPDFFLLFNELRLRWFIRAACYPVFSFRRTWFDFWSLAAEQLAALTLIERW